MEVHLHGASTPASACTAIFVKVCSVGPSEEICPRRTKAQVKEWELSVQPLLADVFCVASACHGPIPGYPKPGILYKGAGEERQKKGMNILRSKYQGNEDFDLPYGEIFLWL